MLILVHENVKKTWIAKRFPFFFARTGTAQIDIAFGNMYSKTYTNAWFFILQTRRACAQNEEVLHPHRAARREKQKHLIHIKGQSFTNIRISLTRNIQLSSLATRTFHTDILPFAFTNLQSRERERWTHSV